MMQHLAKILLAAVLSLAAVEQAFAWGSMGSSTTTTSPPPMPPATMNTVPVSAPVHAPPQIVPPPTVTVPQPPPMSAPASQLTTWSSPNRDGTTSYYRYDPGDNSVVRTLADGSPIPEPSFVQQVAASLEDLFSTPPEPPGPGAPELGVILARPVEK